MQKCFVITAPEVEDTGKVSFAFMFDSKADSSKFLGFKQWGWFRQSQRSAGTVDPFALGDVLAGRSTDKPVDIGGTDQIEIFLFQGGRGQTFYCGCDPIPDAIDHMLKDAPDCCVLMAKPLFDGFSAACGRLGVEVDAHHCETPLKTS